MRGGTAGNGGCEGGDGDKDGDKDKEKNNEIVIERNGNDKREETGA